MESTNILPKPDLFTSTIYSIYLRNHTPEGTFVAAQQDLPRIKALGAEVIWLMPIHPIGQIHRKGGAGSPYAIKDYRGVNPEYGTLDDLRSFARSCHDLGMKCIIDVVYNHTSPDSVLFKEHPDWFYQKPTGGPGNRVGDWTDIIDLDLSNQDLRTYLIDTLKFWLDQGIDGFRCDVAPLLPLYFWMEARQACDLVRPDAIWLSESVEPRFLQEMRRRSYQCLSDGEIFQAFDLAYDYDSFDVWKEYMAGKATFDQWLDVKRRQEFILPQKAGKLRFCENHDQPRSRSWLPDPRAHRNWTAFTAFERGSFLVFGGQEHADPKLPDLFDKDPVNWGLEPEFEPYLRNLITLKKDPIHSSGFYTIHPTQAEGVIIATYVNTAEDLRVTRVRLGIFTIQDKRGTLDLGRVIKSLVSQGQLDKIRESDSGDSAADAALRELISSSGKWSGTNLIDGREILIESGRLPIPQEPVVVDLV
jgi:hypothetical protein